MRKIFIAISFVLISLAINAQHSNHSSVDSFPASKINWYNQSPDNTKITGVAANKAYEELLNNKTPKKKIVVAVIDSGVDTDHEDLKGNIWTNENEIPGNGIDDDNNGYIDDVNGWNFLGSTTGEMIVYESLEMTRIVRDFGKKFEGKSLGSIPSSEIENFNLYTKAKKELDAELEYMKKLDRIYGRMADQYLFSLKLLKIALQKEDFSNAELEAFETESTELQKAKNMVLEARKRGFANDLIGRKEYIDEMLNYNLNVDYNAREISGDDHYKIEDVKYGNNNVEGPEADHGTFVASMIAATRGNGVGIDGIANHAEIMALRAVPKGDEYDKDIALAIRYAVDNGANIINMSFGKGYSPNKEWVDEAMQYAADNNVLLVHAAGNDSKNNDLSPSFPNDKTLTDQKISTWLEIGANSSNHKKELCGSFSNYGAMDVDLFAPGVEVVGCVPNDEYAMLDGTSFACPITSGVAALVWSYYPELTAAQLKDILMASAHNKSKTKVIIPGERRKKTKFRELSVTGGIVNAYNALQMAEQKS
ncbi:MAG: S8 family peptidase [Bacteroidia bacterium]